MAVPRPIAFLAFLANSGLAYYWGTKVFGKGEAEVPLTTNGQPAMGRLGRASASLADLVASEPGTKRHDVSVIQSMRDERSSLLQTARENARALPFLGKYGNLGPIGARVGIIREMTRNYSGLNAALMKNPQHMQKIGVLMKSARRIVAAQCEPSDEDKGDGGWCVPEKNYKAEAAALQNWYRANVRYTRDPLYVDTFSSPDITLGTKAGDCLPGDTLLLTQDRGYQPIELVREGDTVMGDGCWTRVTRWWDKGSLPLRVFKLNNGAVLRCTDEHKLFRVPKDNQRAGRREQAEEVLAKDVQPGDHLLLAEQHPEGKRELDPELAWLIGAFVADGWLDDGRIHIAGRDRVEGREYGKKDKGPQKDRIAAFCAARGIVSHRSEKDIRFRDVELLELLSRCGKGAMNKRLPFTDVTKGTARALLDGLMADASTSKYGTIVFSTISPTLALQIRELHRILGIRTNIKRVTRHGGFGSNPIFRISVIRPVGATGKRGMVHAIVREVGLEEAQHVYDIETDSHRFYLPETDLVVHNCDDACITLGSMLTLIGHNVRFRVIQTKDARTWSHIYLMVDCAADGRTWLPLDATMPHKFPWQADGAADVARTGKPAGMVQRVQDFPL